MPGHRSIPLDYPHWTVLCSRTRFAGVPGYSLIDCIELHTLGASIMFYTLWRHARLQIDSTGSPALNASSLFYMHCSSTIKASFLPLSAFQFEGPAHLSGDRPSRPQSAYIPRTPGLQTSVEARRGDRERERLRETVRLPTLSVSLVLMLWRHARLQIYSIGLPTWNVSIVLYTLWKHARLHTDSIGLPTLHVKYSALVALGPCQGTACAPLDFPHYMQCSSNIKALFLAIPALQFEGLRLTFLVTSQAGPSPHTFAH